MYGTISVLQGVSIQHRTSINKYAVGTVRRVSRILQASPRVVQDPASRSPPWIAGLIIRTDWSVDTSVFHHLNVFQDVSGAQAVDLGSRVCQTMQGRLQKFAV